MKEYILIWYINDYHDMGGGTEFEFYEDLKKVDDKVNELTKDSRITISFCGKIKNEIKFKPVENVTRWEVQD